MSHIEQGHRPVCFARFVRCGYFFASSFPVLLVDTPIDVKSDEFSTIAPQTNRMISGLRERKRLKTVFARYVSEPVARASIQFLGEHPLKGNTTATVVYGFDL